MADGGVSLGLPRDVAYKLASQTLIGSGMMQKETGLHPGILKDQSLFTRRDYDQRCGNIRRKWF